VGDEALALPQLALVPVVRLLRDLDRGLVVAGIDPLGRRHFADPVEAVQSIACHGVKPELLRRESGILIEKRRVGRKGFAADSAYVALPSAQAVLCPGFADTCSLVPRTGCASDTSSACPRQACGRVTLTAWIQGRPPSVQAPHAWIQGVFHFLHFVTLGAAAALGARGIEGDRRGVGEGDIEGDSRAAREGRSRVARGRSEDSGLSLHRRR